MMTLDFRTQARMAIKRALAELASSDDSRARYAALELRIAIEALTYSRAESYRSEISRSEYQTWQPKKLMELLLEIDPSADKNSVVSVGQEREYGAQPNDMRVLGESRVIGLRAIKKHYNALGSHLHLPSLKQMDDGKVQDLAALRGRCSSIISELERILASPIFNANFGLFAELDCMRCGQKVRKRLPERGVSGEAKCFECGAEYSVEDTGEKTKWTARQEKVSCPNPDCGEELVFWKDEIRDGAVWKCPGCRKGYRIGLSIFDDS